MGVNTVSFKRNLSQNTDRGPSAALWADFPVNDVLEDVSQGIFFRDDFNMAGNVSAGGAAVVGSMGQWQVYASQGALIKDAELEGGVIGINSDADQESVTLAARAGSCRIVGTSPYPLGQKLVYECRVAVGTIAATKSDCFVGLADKLTTSDVPVVGIPITTTDDGLSTQPNLIGFHRKSSVGNDWTFVFQLAGGAAVYPTNLTTLVTSVTGSAMVAQSGQTGFVKLGFVYDPNAYPVTIVSASTGQTAGQIARPLIRVFVNGLPAAAFLTSTNVQAATFPTGFMGPVISNMQTAAGANTLFADWVQVGQLARF